MNTATPIARLRYERLDVSGLRSMKGQKVISRTPAIGKTAPAVLEIYLSSWYKPRKYHSGLTCAGVFIASAGSPKPTGEEYNLGLIAHMIRVERYAGFFCRAINFCHCGSLKLVWHLECLVNFREVWQRPGGAPSGNGHPSRGSQPRAGSIYAAHKSGLRSARLHPNPPWRRPATGLR